MLLDTTGLKIVGIVAGFTMTMALIPQLYKVYYTKSVSDLSFLTYLLYSIGVFIWMFYGIGIDDLIIAVFKGIGFLFSFSILVGILIYRKKY